VFFLFKVCYLRRSKTSVWLSSCCEQLKDLIVVVVVAVVVVVVVVVVDAYLQLKESTESHLKSMR